MIALDFARQDGALGYGLCAIVVIACSIGAIRWLRVAQREHYLPGSCTRFARRWWLGDPLNATLYIIALGCAIGSRWFAPTALVVAAVVSAAPSGLSLRGRTSKLIVTNRLARIAWVAGLWIVLVAALGALFAQGVVVASLLGLGAFFLVDLALAMLGPLERRLLSPFVDKAAERLQRISPEVVAITGSFGKTSTKNHLATLIATSRRVVVTPASFNNRAGIARAINEGLTPRTEVFVAEMGTYGPGEIAEMTSWCTPSISIITSIGPVHLERMGSIDKIVAAKSEIVGPAHTVILNVDSPELAQLRRKIERDTPEKRVVGVSAFARSEAVCLERHGPSVSVYLDGECVVGDVELAEGVSATNVACALGAALALGVERDEAVANIARCTTSEHRLSAGRAESGVVVFDDTFNSNPAGARMALDLLCEQVEGRRVLISPGMVELGGEQAAANVALAADATKRGVEVGIVGRTNARALARGARGGVTHRFEHRADAVAWVRSHLGAGDGVLYENDLPDHYP